MATRKTVRKPGRKPVKRKRKTKSHSQSQSKSISSYAKTSWVQNMFESPVSIPKGFILAIDVSEQRPLFVPKRLANGEQIVLPSGLTCQGRILPDGDYSVIGLERIVAVELKRMNDLLSYIGKERTSKTIPKLRRLQNYWWAAIVVQESEQDIISVNTRYETQITPNKVRGFFRSLHIHYGIHSYFNREAERCEYWILEHLAYAFTKLLKQECQNLWRRKRDGIIAAKDYVPLPEPSTRGKKVGWE